MDLLLAHMQLDLDHRVSLAPSHAPRVVEYLFDATRGSRQT